MHANHSYAKPKASNTDPTEMENQQDTVSIPEEKKRERQKKEKKEKYIGNVYLYNPGVISLSLYSCVEYRVHSYSVMSNNG